MSTAKVHDGYPFVNENDCSDASFATAETVARTGFGKPVPGWGKLLGCPDLHVAMFDIVTPPLNPPTFGEAACACC
jgi:hypothetical protein